MREFCHYCRGLIVSSVVDKVLDDPNLYPDLAGSFPPKPHSVPSGVITDPPTAAASSTGTPAPNAGVESSLDLPPSDDNQDKIDVDVPDFPLDPALVGVYITGSSPVTSSAASGVSSHEVSISGDSSSLGQIPINVRDRPGPNNQTPPTLTPQAVWTDSLAEPSRPSLENAASADNFGLSANNGSESRPEVGDRAQPGSLELRSFPAPPQGLDIPNQSTRVVNNDGMTYEEERARNIERNNALRLSLCVDDARAELAEAMKKSDATATGKENKKPKGRPKTTAPKKKTKGAQSTRKKKTG